MKNFLLNVLKIPGLLVAFLVLLFLMVLCAIIKPEVFDI